jgi:hypothetical protein
MRCRFGAKCSNLKKGPGKCKFFHLPEEVAMHHPTFMSLDTSQTESAVLERNKKRTKACRFGLDCQRLRKGPAVCPLYHFPQEICVYHPNGKGLIGTGSKREGVDTVDLSRATSSTNFNSAVRSDQDSEMVKRNILIDAIAGPHVVGKNKKHINIIMKKSGAKVMLTHKVDSNGMCMVWITGTEKAVNKAADMVVEASLRLSKYTISQSDSPEETSILSALTGDESAMPIKTAVLTPTSDGLGTEKLLAFLEQQKSCFKCPPARFYEWLLSEDMDTFENFVEACSDEDYHTVMQENGLKGFKRGPFLRAVKRAAASR